MSKYDAQAWQAIQEWHQPSSPRWKPPATAITVLRSGRQKLRAGIDHVPGSSTVLDAVQNALAGLLGPVDRAAAATLNTGRILARFNRRGHAVAVLGDIRGLDLQVIDRVKPRVDLRYVVALALEGAAAGVAMSGGEIVAAGGTVLGAGAGAAPGIGMLVGVTAADAVAVLAASSRVTSEIAAYYGYDVELPHERLYAAGVLGVGLAPQAGKFAAYQELNKLVQALARRKAWDVLNQNVLTGVIRRVYLAFGERLTQRKLAQAVPVLGIVLGAGLNAKTLADAAEAADVLYRERFLREKYKLGADVDVPTGHPEGVVDIAEILDAEIIEDDGDGIQDQDPTLGVFPTRT